MVATMLTIMNLFVSAQYPSYNNVPQGCGKLCFPGDGYAQTFGKTVCSCKSELCHSKSCNFGQRCTVKTLTFVGDVAICEKAPTGFPTPQLLAGITPSPFSASDRCREPALSGHCRAFIPRYYYNASENVCQQFVYGGCGQNGNNFDSIQECLQTCQPLTGSPFLGVARASSSGPNTGLGYDILAANNNLDNPVNVDRWTSWLYRLLQSRVGGP